ncbi:hypothetical protein DL93DRAFT_2092192 [Clavulina sp. PMI_390]|nr:hypothetical protein DL93DRAFT_2092192 [Clavulina sp. PMI_390]
MRTSSLSPEERRERDNLRKRTKRANATPLARLQERERSMQRRQASNTLKKANRNPDIDSTLTSTSSSITEGNGSRAASPGFHQGDSIKFLWPLHPIYPLKLPPSDLLTPPSRATSVIIVTT